MGVAYYHAQLKATSLEARLRAANIQIGLLEKTKTSSPAGENSASSSVELPFFVFESKQVPWESLAPNFRFVCGGEVDPKVVGTFPAVGDPFGSDNSAIRTDATNIHFPEAGRYYLFTSLGCFKVLILDSAAPDDDKILAMASFVARNCVHSRADTRKLNPNGSYAPYRRVDTAKLIPKLFASDQPLMILCGSAADVLCHLLSRKGYRTRIVHIEDAGRPPKGHMTCEVFFPSQKGWGFIDPDYGAIFKDTNGRVLPISEIARVLRTQPEDALPVDIAGKAKLEPRYDLEFWCPPFTWGRDKMSSIPSVEPASYKIHIRDMTHQYWIYDRNELAQWVNCQKFSWDGSKIGGK